ncbi:hypothetical protein CC79DRAFT_1281621 [Sarocladium strictum]
MQVNSSLSGTGSHVSGVRKARSSTFKACFRCHRRKQRCTGHPTCANCQSANVTCIRDSPVAMRKLAGLSKEELLDRIDDLEDRLSFSAERDKASGRSPPNQNYECQQLAPSRLPTPGCQSQDSIHDETTNELEDTSDAGAAERHQLAELPWPAIGTSREILNTYLDSMHRRVPFFDFKEVLQAYKTRQSALANNHRSRFLAFKLFMVYAIGAMILKLTKLDTETQPEDYLKAANQLKDSLTDLSSIERIEIALFSVLYRLRVSLDSKSWFEIGLAMRIAIEAGLHREEYYDDLHPSIKDWRRRLFWGVYVMERNICFSLKRPFSIPDHDIDTDLPALSRPDTSGSAESFDSCSTAQDPSRSIDLSTSVASINLVRIKSDLYTMIHRVDKGGSITIAQVPSLLERIQEFGQTLPEYIGADVEFLQLHVNNAIRTIIEPFLTVLSPDDELNTICVQAAGRVCQLFKRLRLRKALGYSFPMVNSVFVAGMTICYVLFKNPSLWTPALANDLRACSSILFVNAERNQSLKKYCDVLEDIINSIMDHIEHTSSPNPSSTTEERNHQSDGEGAPVIFHTLKDTFKRLEFELPTDAYPRYTMKHRIGDIRSFRHPPGRPTDPGVSSVGQSERSEAADMDHDKTRDCGHFGDDFPAYNQAPISLDGMQDTVMDDGTSGLYIHEPYMQQMMEELLAQDYFR